MKNSPDSTDIGLPAALKEGVEELSGMDTSQVRVHYNSDAPAQLNAHSYAQGSEIHLAADEAEQHAPREAWHVVQQSQGRVQVTTQRGVASLGNDDAGLENEADNLGTQASQ